VRSWEEAGVPLDGMAAAVRNGALSFSYPDSSAFDRFAGISGTTFQQLSDDTGIPVGLLKVVREAVGFAEPRPEDHVREDELSVVPAIQLQLSLGSGPPSSRGGSASAPTGSGGSPRRRRTGGGPRSNRPSSKEG